MRWCAILSWRTRHVSILATTSTSSHPSCAFFWIFLQRLYPRLCLGDSLLCTFLLLKGTSVFVNFLSSTNPMSMRKPNGMKNSLTLAININLWLFLFFYVLLHSFSLCRPRAATPLLFAAEGGNLDVCQFLVEHKADVNAQNDMHDSRPIRMHFKNSGVIICFNFFSFYSVSGQSSLHWSSANCHIDVCQFLVENKADVNAKDKQYNTHPCTCIGTRVWCNSFLFSTFFLTLFFVQVELSSTRVFW